MTLKTALTCVSFLAFASAPALAQQAAGEPHVITGGVGAEAREDFMKAYRDHNLHLAFADRSGAFLADVEVAIRDAQGREVWSGTTEGPLLFARLPSGRYTVHAEFDGEARQRSIQVGERAGLMQYFHWDVPGVPGPALAGEGAAAAGR
jgi:hypothetical protein